MKLVLYLLVLSFLLQSKVAQAQSASHCCCSPRKLRFCPNPRDYEFVSFSQYFFIQKIHIATLKKFFCNTFSLMQSIQEKNVILELLEL